MAVLDASFIVKLVLNEDCTTSALETLRRLAAHGEELHAPCIAVAEALNAVWKHVTLFNDVGRDEAGRVLNRLHRLLRLVTLHPVGEVARRALELSIARKITFYDALYAALAESLSQTLYTYDARLAARLADSEIRVAVPGCPEEGT